MKQKRIKIAKGLSSFVPVTINFSDLNNNLLDENFEYQPSDYGLEKRRKENNFAYEELVIQIMSNLDFKYEKLIFTFQLLRDNGFQIDHGSFAKAMGLSRRQYMRVLSIVRIKAALYTCGYSGSHKESK